jgi:hypothetical protein
MKSYTALAVLALLIIAIGCSSADNATTEPPTAPSENPVVDTFDASITETAPDEDMRDLESLDADLAAFE